MLYIVSLLINISLASSYIKLKLFVILYAVNLDNEAF